MDEALAGLSLGEQKRKLIVGIDFGTTYSGVAWTETRRPDQQTIINVWPYLEEKEGKTMDKVPTEIRYTDNGMEWGYQIPIFEDRHRWFKLGLRGGLSAEVGDKDTPEALSSAFLTALNKHLLYTLEQKLGSSILRTIPIEYCLTVPAIWSELAKDKTLKAARKAGLAGNIMLVSEPEAAAIYTLNSLDPHDLKIGDTFVLCDAGGGTVDLISYTITQLDPKLRIKEASPGTGGMCGSTFLNRRFQEFLTEKVGNEEGWDFELLAEATEKFDTVIKKQYSPASSYTILVPGLANNERLGIRRGRLLVTPTEMKPVFEKVVNDVIDLVKKQIASSKRDIRAVLLVGGFGENSYLKGCLRTALGKSIEIIQPPNAWTAVTRGAVLMGLGNTNEELATVRVTSRAARKHYGIELSAPFDSDIHDESEKFVDKLSGEYEVLAMEWFIRKGDPVKETEVKRIRFCYEFAVKSGRPREATMRVQCDENSSEAPIHPNEDCRTLVILRADLSSIPDVDIESNRRKHPNGEEYYQLSGAVEATYLSASTKYVLIFMNKQYDTVSAEYA